MDKAVYVVGVGMTKFEKPGAKKDDYPMWVKEAVEIALEDAKIDYAQIQQVFASYAIGDSGCGQRAMQEVGLTGIPIFNVSNNCSSGASAIYLAKEFIGLGKYDCILVAGFEKMNKDSAWPNYTDRAYFVQNHIKAISNITHFDENITYTLQFFGIAGIEHMQKYGTTPECLAKIAYKNRKHAVNNPYAQFQKEYSVEEILNSPKKYGPLTLLQCCPLSCGAAAVILASKDFVIKNNLQTQAVEILGLEMVTDFPSSLNADSMFPIIGCDITKEAMTRLLRNTKKSIDDIQVIELHDSFSTLELILYEAIGLCPPGEGGKLVDRGDNTYGGKYVINPSGGLIGKGHPFGATGVAQCVELCWQLRGEAGKRQVEDVKLALQHNLGMATAVVVALYQRATFT